jgi:hypothetical protein
MTEQVFIDSQGRERAKPTGTLIPQGSFRWKAGVLQQLHSANTGFSRYWINVPTVADDAPDVMG